MPTPQRSAGASKVIRSTTDYIHRDSRQDRYHPGVYPEHHFLKLRKPTLVFFKSIPELINRQDKLLKLYRLKGIGYGQWVNNEQRFNYLAATIIAIYDIEKVLKFKNNFGLNSTVSISIGARGAGGFAAAHFEPWSFIINLTRHSRGDQFTDSGGIGSLAHEYGHALDFYIGYYLEPARSFNRPLTDIIHPIATTHPARRAMINLLESIKKDTQLYQRKKAKGLKGYWTRPSEVFARAFEVYIHYHLKKKGILNRTLTKYKYQAAVYLTPKEFTKVLPHMEKLISVFRTYLATRQ